MDNKRTCALDYESEYKRLMAQTAKLSEECRYLNEKAQALEMENEILRAKLSIVNLIFGGPCNG